MTYEQFIDRYRYINKSLKKNENIEKEIEEINENNYKEKFQALPYQEKVRLILYCQVDDVDIKEYFELDDEFIEEFKNDTSVVGLTAKITLSKEEKDKYYNFEEAIEKNKENVVKSAFFSSSFKNSKNADIKKILNDSRIIEAIKNDKQLANDLFSSFFAYNLVGECIDNPEYIPIYKEHICERIMAKKESLSLSAHYFQNVSEDVQMDILKYIKEHVELEKVSDYSYEEFIKSFCDKKNVENSEKKLDYIVGRDYEALNKRGMSVIKQFVELTDDHDMLEALMKNQEILSRAKEDKGFIGDLVKKDLDLDTHIKLLDGYKGMFDISNCDMKLQHYLAQNYDKYQENIKFNLKIDSLDESIVSDLVQNDAFKEDLTATNCITLFQKGQLTDLEFIKDKLINSSSNYNIKVLPSEIIDSMTEKERDTLFYGLSPSNYEEILSTCDNIHLKAYRAKIVEDDMSHSTLIYPETTYFLADEEQKERMLKIATMTDLIKIMEAKPDTLEVKSLLLSKKNELGSLGKYDYLKLFENISRDEFEEIKEFVDFESLMDIDLEYKINQEIRNNVKESIVEYIKNNIEELDNISAREEIVTSALESIPSEEKEMFLKKLNYRTLEFLSGNIKDENLRSKYEEIKLEVIKEHPDNISSWDLDKMFKNMSKEEKADLIANMSLENILKLHNDARKTNDEEMQEICKEKISICKSNGYAHSVVSQTQNMLDYSENINEVFELFRKKDIVNNKFFSEMGQASNKFFADKLVDTWENACVEIKDMDINSLKKFIETISDEDKEKIFELNSKYIESLGVLGKDEALYNKIFDSNISNQKFAIDVIEKGYYTEENKEKLEYILEKNKYALNSFNPMMLDEKFSVYSKEVLEKICRYPSLQKKLIENKDNKNIDVFNKILTTTLNSENISKEIGVVDTLMNEVFKVKDNARVLGLIDSNMTIDQVENLKEYLLRRKPIVYGEDNKYTTGIQVEIRTQEDIYNYKEKLFAKCDEIFEKSDSLDEKKNVVATRFFGMSYNELKAMKFSYLNGMREKESAFSKENRDIMECFDVVCNAQNIETIDGIYHDMSLTRTEFTRKDIIDLESSIRGEFSKDISDSLYKVKDEDIVKQIDFNGKEVRVIEPKNEFFMMVNSTAAYGKMDIKDDNYLKSWNDSERTSNHGICCSLISDECIATADINDVLFGFDSFGKDALHHSAPYDLYTDNDSMKITASRASQYHTASNMIDYTRHTHNETDIERAELRDESELKEKDKQFTNIQPSYVIIFEDMEDELKQKAYKCASEMDIDVIKLDREKLAQRSSQKIDELIAKYKENLNINDIEKILNIHENNRAGYRIGKPELVEKYFDSNKIDTFVKEAVNDIVSEYRKETNVFTEAKVKRLEEILLNEKLKFDTTNETVARTNEIDLNLEDCLTTINKEVSYLDKNTRMFTLDSSILTDEDVKNVNLMESEAMKCKKEKITIQEKEAYEKKMIYTNEMIKDSDLTDKEKRLLIKTSTYELLNKDERKEFLGSYNKSLKLKDEKMFALSMNTLDLDDPLEQERLRYKYGISEEDFKSVSKINNMVYAARMIENGEIDKTNIDDSQKQYLSKVKKIIESEYDRSREEYDIKRGIDAKQVNAIEDDCP